MKNRPYSSYNVYFLIPFAIWVVVGGIMLLTNDKQALFAMFNTHYTTATDYIMFAATHMGEAPFITVVLLLLLGLSSLRNWWYLITAILSGLLPTLVTHAVKDAVDAPRPLKYFNEAAWVHTLPSWERLMNNSFPSGHTCGAFSMFCLISFLLKPQYKFWGIVFFALALLVGYSRMYLAAHFFEDVYVGSIVGTSVTLAVMFVMQKVQPYFVRKQ